MCIYPTIAPGTQFDKLSTEQEQQKLTSTEECRPHDGAEQQQKAHHSYVRMNTTLELDQNAQVEG